MQMVAQKRPESHEHARTLISRLDAAIGERVLVFGASNVPLVEEGLERGRRITVIDIRASAFDKFRHLASSVDFRLVEEHKEFDSFGREFETVLFYDTLHHVRAKARVISEARRVLDENGTAVVYEPNIYSKLAREYDQFGQLKESVYKLTLIRLLEAHAFAVTLYTSEGLVPKHRAFTRWVQYAQRLRLDPLFRILLLARRL